MTPDEVRRKGREQYATDYADYLEALIESLDQNLIREFGRDPNRKAVRLFLAGGPFDYISFKPKAEVAAVLEHYAAEGWDVTYHNWLAVEWLTFRPVRPE